MPNNRPGRAKLGASVRVDEMRFRIFRGEAIDEMEKLRFHISEPGDYCLVVLTDEQLDRFRAERPIGELFRWSGMNCWMEPEA